MAYSHNGVPTAFHRASDQTIRVMSSETIDPIPPAPPPSRRDPTRLTSYKDMPPEAFGISHETPDGIPLAAIGLGHLPLKRCIYNVGKHAREKRGSLMDRGANGGIIGDDAIVIHVHNRAVDVTGINNHELSALKIVDAAGKLLTQNGPVIGIFRQYAYHGINRSIHSSGQFEAYRNVVHDRSLKVGGSQCIRTNDGYVIPLDMINGLPYLKMQPHTEHEWNTLPQVILTSGDDWDPTVLDNNLSGQPDWYNTVKDLQDGLISTPFDEHGNYRNRQIPKPVTILPPIPNGDVDAPAIPTLGDLADSNDLHVDLNAHVHDLRCAFHSAGHVNQIYLCHAHERETTRTKVDYNQYRPYFLHVDVDKVRKTFQRTTQFATNVMAGHRIQQTIHSPFPAHNVWRRNEPVASDTIFGEAPAVDTNGQTMAQIFIGRKSLVIDVFGMSTESEFVNTLEDEIRKRGAMDKLITDSARVEISKRVGEILRALCIDDWQSEANYQHQNHAEHRWQFLKKNTQWYMNWRNVPANAWLLCTQWVADVMNHTSERSLDWRPPLEVLTGQTIEISILLVFLFWDVVYVARYNDQHYQGQVGSKKSSEIRGHFVGFAHNVGHALTFKILTCDTNRVINRSRVRLAKDGENNLKLDKEAGAVPERIFIKSKRDKEGEQVKLPTIDISKNPFNDPEEHLPDRKGEQPSGEPPKTGRNNGETRNPTVETIMEDQDEDQDEYGTGTSPMDSTPLSQCDEPTVEASDIEELTGIPEGERQYYTKGVDSLKTDGNILPARLPPTEMIDRTFLMPPEADGTRHRAKIIALVDEHLDEMLADPDRAAELAKFRCRVGNDHEEIVAYNDIADYIEQDDGNDGVWRFKEILDHKGPLHSTHKDYKGARYNVFVSWETGETSWEPLHTKEKTGIYNADPVSVAIYAAKKGLLDTPGWKLPGLKKLAKTQQRLIRTANKAKLHSFRTTPIYMFGVLVPRNVNQALEIDAANGDTKWADAIDVELAMIDSYNTFTDKGKGFQPSPDYKKIRVHIVFACKHDGRRKARLVAGGHLTDTPIDSVYSSVVPLRGIRMLTFLSELNGNQAWATDIGNAYLESYTQEKVYIIAGPEFGDREGHTLIITKALYGLRTSGLRWAERFSDVLRDMGFFPSKAATDIWMRDKGTHYEYIGVYVDDLLLVSNFPSRIISDLENTHKFKLKGTGPISFHLGADFFRDEQGRLCSAPLKYIEKMMSNYVRIFGRKPKEYVSPLLKGDHPELDKSELLDMEHVKIYQSLIGALQWIIQLGRFDVCTAVMTMSRFRAAPRQGHLDRVKRIHGYISKMRHATIRIRTEEPDYSNIPRVHYSWENSVYRGAKEELPKDAPPTRGARVVLTSYVDANLYHDLISGKSVTGILHMANQTVIDFHSKLQSTVETATFGSEYVAARTCTEQIIDLRTSFRYLGVDIAHPTMMFGDNESVVNTASMPHSKLSKRHNALSYHKTRSCIAAGIIRFHHIPGAFNPADILSKHWDYPSVWTTLRPLLFLQGPMAERGPITWIRDLIQDATHASTLTAEDNASDPPSQNESVTVTEGSDNRSFPDTTRGSTTETRD